jgi:hypothetical protein
MIVKVADVPVHVQRLLSIVKMTTMLEACSAKEQRSFCLFLSSYLPLNNIFSIHISVSFQKTMYGANVIIFEGILAFYYAEILKVSSSLLQTYGSFFR